MQHHTYIMFTRSIFICFCFAVLCRGGRSQDRSRRPSLSRITIRNINVRETFSTEAITAQFLYPLIGTSAHPPSTMYDVQGCDLGIVVTYSGMKNITSQQLVYLFGDTFGDASNATYKSDWRSNTMAFATSKDHQPPLLQSWLSNRANGCV